MSKDKNETQRGDATELGIANTLKVVVPICITKWNLTLKVKSYVGSKNKMVFLTPQKFWREPDQGEEGGWKQICDAMDYFLSAVDEDRIDLEKQWESRMAQPDPFFNLPRKREVPFQWHRPDLIST